MKRRRDRARPDQQNTPPKGSTSAGRWPRWLVENRSTLAAAVLLIGWFGVRPVAADSLWWELARGRAVLSGSWTPSADLLVADDRPETDWLAGVPAFAAWTAGGSTGLMLLRLLAIGAVTCWVLRRVRGAHAGGLSLRWLLTATTLVLCQTALDVTPRLWDILFFVALTWTTEKDAHWGPFPALILLSAQMAPAFAACVLVWTLIESESPAPGRWARFGWGCVACLLTPRFLWGTWDSLRLTTPAWWSPTWVETPDAWAPLAVAWTRDALQPTYVCFGVLSLFLAWELWRRSAGPGRVAAWGVAQCLAWASVANLPIASLWMIAATYRDPDSDSPPSGKWLRRIGPALVLAVMLACAPLTELGWGIQQRLDPRYVQQSTSGDGRDEEESLGACWCDSLRTAGLAAWARPANTRPWDAPHRALLHGRLADHALLEADLRENHRNAYTRDDGGRGGWWSVCEQRNVRLMLTDARNTQLIRGLEPTLWKPLTLDSPMLVFARAGDPRHAPVMIEILRQRAMVESGAWLYQPPPSSNSAYDRPFGDLFPEATGVEQVTPRLNLQQARVFAAMDLPFAAARVLAFGVRRWPSHRGLATEFAANQARLAHAEWLAAGEISEFRAASLNAARRRADDRSRLPAPLAEYVAAPGSLSENVIADYVRGRADAALNQLSDADRAPEAAYAIGLLAHELGDLDRAAAAWTRATKAAAETPGGLAAWMLRYHQLEDAARP